MPSELAQKISETESGGKAKRSERSALCRTFKPAARPSDRLDFIHLIVFRSILVGAHKNFFHPVFLVFNNLNLIKIKPILFRLTIYVQTQLK